MFQCHLVNEPQYRGIPSVVVQYQKSRENLYANQFDPSVKRGGDGIIAVSYEARAAGVKRSEHRFLKQAQKLCPDLHAFQVNEKYGKADLTLYRTASKKVVDIIKRFCPTMERASIDECYLDLTELVKTSEDPDPSTLGNVWMANMESIPESIDFICNSCDPRFARATQIVSNIRKAIFEELGYTCSAGISTNKLMAKFIAGMRKPNAQCTLLPADTECFMSDVSVRKLRGFGGKLGSEICMLLDVKTCGQVQQIPLRDLKDIFQDNAKYIWEMVRGIDNEEVKTRYTTNSIGSGRNFMGVDSIVKRVQVTYWIKEGV